MKTKNFTVLNADDFFDLVIKNKKEYIDCIINSSRLLPSNIRQELSSLIPEICTQFVRHFKLNNVLYIECRLSKDGKSLIEYTGEYK